MDVFIQQVVSGLATGSIYAALALALVMIYEATDVVNFAQGEMAMFATYICWSLITAGIPYWVALFATLVIAFVGGVVIERVVIRPVENARRICHAPGEIKGVERVRSLRRAAITCRTAGRRSPPGRAG